MSAYKLYEAGISVPKIAEKIWEKKGYASQRACVCSLYYSFSSYKLRMRNAGSARWVKKTCTGCGCDFGEKTQGCSSCSSRFYWRKKRKEQRQKALIKERRQRKECITCGVPQTQHTLGCETCGERHSKRTRRDDPEWREKEREYHREYDLAHGKKRRPKAA